MVNTTKLYSRDMEHGKPPTYKSRPKPKEKEIDKITKRQKYEMAVVSPYISIITLHVNGLNSATKRHWVDGWIKKQNPNLCCQQETHFWSKGPKWISRRWFFKQVERKKKAGIAILRSIKIDFKPKMVKQAKKITEW